MVHDTKIYFCGSICGGRNDVHLYDKIVRGLNEFGEVLNPVVADATLTHMDREGSSDVAIHDGDIVQLKKCDFVVAEVTQPSLGVGYEIGRAVALNKKVYCLYRPGHNRRLSAMIRGAVESECVQVFDYKEEELQSALQQLLTAAKEGNSQLNWGTYEPM